MNTRGQCLTIFFFLYFVVICRGIHLKLDPRIVGGEPADIHDFPYQLSLEVGIKFLKYFYHTCGASVISKDWAVTAAHCFKTSWIRTYRVRAGTSIKGDTGATIYEIEEIIVHPKFDDSTVDYDIAVIRVSQPFQYSDVLQPIELTKTTPPGGTLAVASGWGCLNYEGIESKQLYKVTLRILDFEVCRESVQHNLDLTPRMLCTTVPESDKGICKGDSGGPLVTEENQLVGIMSMTDKNLSHIHADVAVLRDWITSVTGII